MAKETKYFAIVNGETVGTRRTRDRTYTHVIVGRVSYKAALAAADTIHKYDLQNFAYYQRQIAAGPGGQHPNVKTWIVDQQQYDNAVAKVGNHTTAESYAEAERAQRVAEIKAKKAAGYYDKLEALTWCGRLDLAQKQLGRWPHHEGLQIVEAVKAERVA